jgi:uncharacterized sporulation protein YeaH/YhbH (DUF444 family)
VGEPNFGHAHGGMWETINPGNQNTRRATGSIVRAGRRRRRAVARPAIATSHEDDFIFELSREEFMNYFFEDLELPNMVKKQLTATTEFKNQRAGYTMSGTPSNIHVLRSLRGALGRRIAVGGKRASAWREAERRARATCC